ncbi:MAG: hypothetical protein GEU90_03005 [Gemmatimonas sp.]|nr:hypothetical protein [Gemmatimonas sp.]
MHAASRLCLVLGASIVPVLLVSEAGAQGTYQAHVGHVMEGFPGAPDGAALLSVAQEDAAVAAQHAELAGGEQTNLDPMVQHAQHVLHALDPSAAENGPGSGFGVGPAADAIAEHIELAAGADGAPEPVVTHSAHVATAARAVSERSAEMVEVANSIIEASDYSVAYPLVQQLQELAGQLVAGADASGDGEIGLDEGGLELVETHMGLMSSAALAQ